MRNVEFSSFVRSFESNADFALCRAVAARSRSNFVAAFRFFPIEKRIATTVLYAFMRLTDDLADLDFSANRERAPNDAEKEEMRERLDSWRDATQNLAFADLNETTFDAKFNPESDRRDFLKLPNAAEYRAALSALRIVRRRFPIPIDSLLAVVDGMKFDLKPSFRAKTLADSLDYCDKAATSVGLALLAILGASAPLDSPEILSSARGCGRALQWTNFLRDVAEDVRRDRIYFPATDFATSGLSVERWRLLATSKKGICDARDELRDADSPLSRFFRIQFERTNAFFLESEELFSLVDADSRRPLRLMSGVYRAIFQKIEAAPFRVFGRRTRASFWQKARLVGQIILSSSIK